MRIALLLLGLLLLFSCGRLPSAPVPARGSGGGATLRPSIDPAGPDTSADDGRLQTPEVLSLRVARAGDDIQVTFVGRPREPGLHPWITRDTPGGYAFAMSVLGQDCVYGGIPSIRVLDEHHVEMTWRPWQARRTRAGELASEESRVFPLHGGGTSWSFRFPQRLVTCDPDGRYWWTLHFGAVTGRPGAYVESIRGTIEPAPGGGRH